MQNIPYLVEKEEVGIYAACEAIDQKSRLKDAMSSTYSLCQKLIIPKSNLIMHLSKFLSPTANQTFIHTVSTVKSVIFGSTCSSFRSSTFSILDSFVAFGV